MDACKVRCGDCFGHGEIYVRRYKSREDDGLDIAECKLCDGSGEVAGQCSHCDGRVGPFTETVHGEYLEHTCAACESPLASCRDCKWLFGGIVRSCATHREVA